MNNGTSKLFYGNHGIPCSLKLYKTHTCIFCESIINICTFYSFLCIYLLYIQKQETDHQINRRFKIIFRTFLYRGVKWLLVYLILAEHVLVLMRTCLTKINETAQDWIVSQLPISDIMCRLQSAFAPKPRVTLICFSFPQFSCPYWTSGRSR